jgi:hypothetical protein
LTDFVKQLQLTAATAATTTTGPEGIFKTAVDIFKDNINTFDNSINKLAQALNVSQLVEEGAVQAEENIAEIETRAGISKKELENLFKFGTKDPEEFLTRFKEATDKAIESQDTFGGNLIQVGASLLGFSEELENFIREQAAPEVGRKQAELAIQRDVSPEQAANIEKNVTQLLRGVIQDSSGAAITQDARKNLIESINTERQAIEKSVEQRTIEQGIASQVQEAQQTIGRRDSPRFLVEQTATGGERGLPGEQITNELQQIKEALNRIPEDIVITPELIEKVRQGELPGERLEGFPGTGTIDPANLEAALTPAFTNSLTATLPTALQPLLQPTQEQGQVDSTSQVVEAADRLASAAEVTSETTAAITTGGETLRAGTEVLASATDRLSTGIGELAAIVDIQREAAQATDSTEIAGVTNELAEASRSNTEAINKQSEQIAGLNEKLTQRIAQADEPQPISVDELEIEGLEDVRKATAENSEALASNEQGLSTLSQELIETSAAIKQGISLDIQAANRVQVDVEGLEDSVREFEEAFGTVAREVAKEQIRIALSNLADKLENTDLSQNVQSVINTLT